MAVYRTIDGTGNNVANPTLNATGTPMVRVGVEHFDSDGSPIEGVNPRVVSNVVVGEGNASTPNVEGLSGFMFAWGQFLDHDLDLMRSDGVNRIDITVPPDDQMFPPGSVLPLTRTVVDADGDAINNITGWIDGSMVYGSTQAVADSLRLPDGHLATSAGDNLPLNAAGRFLAGDVRAQENPDLTSLHTLFVREHNHQVDLLAVQHPNWTGEHLYQEARTIVSGEIANITYYEFLPHLLGKGFLDSYKGYNPSVDPTISEEFAGAAYRFGHSMVSNVVDRIGNDGAESGPELSLAASFGLSAAGFVEFDGADGFLRALASAQANAIDGRIVDGLRNFLAEGGGLDLAAVNLQRGHDLGLGTLNETRAALGLPEYTKFEQLTKDPGTLAALKEVYADVDQVDLWVGGIAEKHMGNGAAIGATFANIIANQFEDLRDGDRFYFERKLAPAVVAEIKETSLSDIIERNTDTDVVQADAFVFTERHASDVAISNPKVPQLIIGVDVEATLVGGTAKDTLVAGAGDNVMTGKAGADVFVFNAAVDASQQSALITDFKRGADHILIENIPGEPDNKGDLQITHGPGDVVIEVGNVEITLAGVNNVNKHDFLFDG